MNGQLERLSPWKLLAIFFVLALGLVVACTRVNRYDSEFTTAPQTVKENRLALTRASFGQLEGWQQDDLRGAFQSFANSCRSFLARDPSRFAGRTTLSGQVRDWQPACLAMRQVDPNSTPAIRYFFETHFQPYAVHGERKKQTANNRGTFTGYYEAELQASNRPYGPYRYPIYAKPHELILEGSKASRLDEFGRVVTFYDRSQIESGVLKNRGYELLWASNPVDLFMLHIQGSGIAKMDDGSQVRLSYASHNGHPFRSIVPAMEAEGFERSYGLDIQSMSRWLKENPAKAHRAMLSNPRFIFFAINRESGPMGAQGVPLTPRRSLAVDPNFIPLGSPLWLNTRAHNGETTVPLQRLVIAQDTGNAIKGPIRGDFYWGSGADALQWAGNMKEKGGYHILLPKKIQVATR
jgi:membrane-bound lytic murein transglycosylase A